MKRLVLAVLTVALLALTPAAVAQIPPPNEIPPAPTAPPLPAAPAGVQAPPPAPGDPTVTGRTERTPRTPGTGRTERTERTPRTPRVGEEPVRRLPRTGVNPTALALDAATLLGAGLLMLHARRRLLSH